ncbi:MAG: hypothetical protein J6L89_04360 [Clostridia bacterium]|nr:hypothetical protein [Clostridia bacterium]
MDKDRCVLVCVTSQSSCERLIRAGAIIASENDCSLLVLSVFPTNGCYTPDLDTIGELDRCARGNNAQMLLFYNDFPFIVAASVAKKYNAINIVTGFCENGVSEFITSLHAVLPETAISMVDKDEKIYNIIPDVISRTH